MKQRKFVINKIKKVDDGWNLYPVDDPSLPIFWEEPSDEDLEDFFVNLHLVTKKAHSL